MGYILKPLAQESHANTGANSTFSNSELVRVVNLSATDLSLISRKYANGSVIASFTMLPKTELIVQKNDNDVLTANTEDVYGCPVAYTNE